MGNCRIYNANLNCDALTDGNFCYELLKAEYCERKSSRLVMETSKQQGVKKEILALFNAFLDFLSLQIIFPLQ